MATLDGTLITGTTDDFHSDVIDKSKQGALVALEDATALPGSTSPGNMSFG